MTRRLSDVMAVIGGELVRDGEFESLGYLHHEGARKLSWIENGKYLPALLGCDNLAAVVAHPRVAGQIPESLGVILHSTPRAAFYLIHNFLALHSDFYGKPFPSEIHPTAVIHPKAHVDETGVRIGADVRLDAGSIVLSGTVIADGAAIHPGSVIGAQGFEYQKYNGRILRVWHTGGVLIEAGVDIQANSTVVRAIFGGASTVVGAESKIDCHVSISHHCVVGKRCFLAAGTSLSGSVSIGDDAWIGPGVTVSNGLRIGSGSRVTIGAVVVSSVPDNAHVTGNWAIPHLRFLTNYANSLAPGKK